MQMTGAINLGYIRGRFTWQNNHEGLTFIRERLDCVVALEEWLSINLTTLVKILNLEFSDYRPILICTTKGKGKSFKPFRFFKAWIFNPPCFFIVKRAWNEARRIRMVCHALRRSLNNTSRVLRAWNKFHFGCLILQQNTWTKIARCSLKRWWYKRRAGKVEQGFKNSKS